MKLWRASELNNLGHTCSQILELRKIYFVWKVNQHAILYFHLLQYVNSKQILRAKKVSASNIYFLPTIQQAIRTDLATVQSKIFKKKEGIAYNSEVNCFHLME